MRTLPCHDVIFLLWHRLTAAGMIALAATLAEVCLNQEKQEEPEDEVDSLHNQIKRVVVPVPGVGADILARSVNERIVSDARNKLNGCINIEGRSNGVAGEEAERIMKSIAKKLKIRHEA